MMKKKVGEKLNIYEKGLTGADVFDICHRTVLFLDLPCMDIMKSRPCVHRELTLKKKLSDVSRGSGQTIENNRTSSK